MVKVFRLLSEEEDVSRLFLPDSKDVAASVNANGKSTWSF